MNAKIMKAHLFEVCHVLFIAYNYHLWWFPLYDMAARDKILEIFPYTIWNKMFLYLVFRLSRENDTRFERKLG